MQPARHGLTLIRSTLDYLREKLGEEFFRRIEARWGTLHPAFQLLLGTPFPFRRLAGQRLVNWTADMRALDACQNLSRVLPDLRMPNKCQHAYWLIEAAARVQRENMEILFEPPASNPESGNRPDALIGYQPTKEEFYFELASPT